MLEGMIFHGHFWFQMERTAHPKNLFTSFKITLTGKVSMNSNQYSLQNRPMILLTWL